MFITAEIGTHWKGDFKLLDRIVKKCKEVGFNAVKLQAFRLQDLNSRYYRCKASVTPDYLPKIDKICRHVGIEWYCMPTYVEAVDFLDPYVNRFKIRYRDSEDVSLLHKIFSKGKPVIISSEEPKNATNGQVTTLYCINKYPHTMEEVDYKKMERFDGFSCHCSKLECVLKAVEHGITHLEVHITQDPKDPTLADNPVAFNLDDCKHMIESVRKHEQNRDNTTS